MDEAIDYFYVPAEIKVFFQFEGESTIYCLVHSCHYKNEKSLVLSKMWMKVYKDVPVLLYPLYRNGNHVDIDGIEPIYWIVSTESIKLHCLLVPFQESLCFMLEILHPTNWPDKFLEIP